MSTVNSNKHGHKGIKPHGGVLVNRFGSVDTGDMYTLDTNMDLASDVENIADGIMSPLEGFMNRDDLDSVMNRGRLASDLAWTIPMILTVDKNVAGQVKDAGEVLLRDPLGLKYAVLHVQDTFKISRKEMARKIFGTVDTSHPGVVKTMSSDGFAVGGKITYLQRPPMTVMRRHRLTPLETRDLFHDMNWKTIVAFQTRNPPHVAHEMLQKTSITVRDGVFISPILGQKKSGDFTNEVIIKSYELMILYYYAPNRCKMSTLHTEMKYAGPKEAIHHAIMRQNYGCTHIAIGRDHAGVGGYYEPFAAHKIFDEYPDLEIAPIFFPTFFYCRSCLTFTNAKVCPHGEDDRYTVSGTKLREIIESNTMPSKYIMRPEVARLILRIPNKFVLEAVKYDPKSRKARTLFARQALKNHFAVVLMSAGLMNNVLKRATSYEAIPARTLGMYKDMLLAVSRAGMVLDDSEDLLDAALLKDTRNLLSKIKATELSSGVGAGYPDYDGIKEQISHCTKTLDRMGEDVVFK